MDTPVAQPTTPQVAQPVPPPPPVVPPPVAPTKPKNVLVTVVMVLIALFSLCVAGYFAYQYMQEKQQAAITTFEACSKAAGSAMQASYPAVCVTRDGKRFTQPLTPEEQQNLLPPDPTADLSRAVPRDWKTYTNTQFQFAFRYPDETNGLYGFFCDDLKIFALDKTPKIGSQCGPRDSYYTIEVRTVKGEPIKEDELSSFESAQSIKETITIGEITGIKATFTQVKPAPIPEKWIEILMYKNGVRYHFILSDMAFEKVFDQILSTFQFIDQNNQGNQTGGQQVNCPATRPQICSMLCLQPPPYICGSDGKSYCSVCQACSNKDVAWYEMSDSPCEKQFCGGIAGVTCPEGYFCKLDGNYPDAGGVCTKN
jgi:hypothetical protein